MNSHIPLLYAWLLLVGLTLSFCSLASGQTAMPPLDGALLQPIPQSLVDEVDSILETRKIHSPGVHTTNDWIEEIKRIGGSTGRGPDASLLVKLGDPVATEETFQKYEQQTNATQQVRAFQLLRKTERLDLILRLKQKLFAEESPEVRLIQQEFLIDPPSVQSAMIILETLVVAPVVAGNVREWAGQQYGSGLTNAEKRERVRRWFLQNTAALEQKRYSELTLLK